jgi:hypothetical protein
MNKAVSKETGKLSFSNGQSTCSITISKYKIWTILSRDPDAETVTVLYENIQMTIDYETFNKYFREINMQC